MSHHGEHTTGTSDEQYDLVSVLYHALEGAATCEVYIQDAEEAGDGELTQFFQELREEENRRAERAKALLATRLSQQATAAR